MTNLSDFVKVGLRGEPGIGVPEGGEAGQILVKTEGNTAWANPTSVVSLTIGTPIITSRNLTNEDLEGDMFYDVDSSSPIVITIPSGLTGNKPVTFQQIGTGSVSFLGSGVTIQSLNGHLNISGRYGSASIIPKGSDVYGLIGSLVE